MLECRRIQGVQKRQALFYAFGAKRLKVRRGELRPGQLRLGMLVARNASACA